jgi:hypothetical protein
MCLIHFQSLLIIFDLPNSIDFPEAKLKINVDKASSLSDRF